METRKFIDDVILYCCYLINSLFALIISISIDLILIQPLDRSYQYINRYINDLTTIIIGHDLFVSCICILVFHLTMLFYDFNFSLFQCRHDDKDTQVKKLMIFKNILNKKELSLNLIIINITTHFRPNFLRTENIFFVRNFMLFFESNNHSQH